MKNASNPNRRINVKLGGLAVRNGRVPVSLLAKTLNGMQKTINGIGECKLHAGSTDRSRAAAIVQRQCELFLIETKPGSLEATLELADRERLLFPEDDIGEAALGDLRQILASISANDAQSIRSIIPDPGDRRKVIRTLARVMPRDGADYCLEIGLGRDLRPFVLQRPPEDRLKEFIGVAEEERPEAAHEATIQAQCRAQLSEEGELERIVEVINYEVIDAEQLWPYRPSEIVWEHRKFILNREIACAVNHEEGLWVIEYEPLSISVFADTHEGAITEFNQEFALLWDEYAMAADDELTGDAVALKRHLKEIVRDVVPG